MIDLPDLKIMTKLLADDSRLEILSILMDGRFHTVHELARSVKIKDQTASYHLSKMLEQNWLEMYQQGRYVYYRLASEEVAELLEHLMGVAPKVKVASLNQNLEYFALKDGRTCYHHLAGKLGVKYFKDCCDNGFLFLQVGQLSMTEKGENYFDKIGINLQKVKRQSGIFMKPCVDWTERSFHLAGNLGKALLNNFEEKELIERNSLNRAVKLTAKGQKFFDFE